MFSVLQIKSDKSFSMKKERIPVLFFFFYIKPNYCMFYIKPNHCMFYIKPNHCMFLHKTEFPQVLLMISVVSVRFHL